MQPDKYQDQKHGTDGIMCNNRSEHSGLLVFRLKGTATGLFKVGMVWADRH